MQLSINAPSAWLSASSFRPFLLIGVAGVSAVALYTPLSSQATSLKEKLNEATLKPLSPISKKLTDGSQKLFEQLASWAKTGANTTDKVKEWINEAAGGNVPEGAKHIFVTLSDWAEKVYIFLKSLFTKEVWDRIKENIKMLGNILNLFKNIMKAELNGNKSILSELVGAAGSDEFGQIVSSLNEMNEKNPDLLNDLDSKDMEDLSHALSADPEGTAKIMKELAEKENVSKQEMMNALKPPILIGKIKNAIERAQKFDDKVGGLSSTEKEEAQKVLTELKDLSTQLNALIEKAEAAKLAKAKRK